MAELYKIGEVAHLSGLTVKTLRFYDEIGLFRPARVHPVTRYRGYEARQFEELTSLLALKDLGLSLSELRGLKGNGRSVAQRREVLLKLGKKLEASIEAAHRSLSALQAALDELDDLAVAMAVSVKRIEPLLVAATKVRVDRYSDVAPVERQLLDSLPPHIVGTQRGVLWHRCADADYLEAEPFFELKRRIPARSHYDVKELPAAEVAFAFSGTDDQSSESAYGAIRGWMAARGHRLAGPKREIYLRDALQIQFPLALA